MQEAINEQAAGTETIITLPADFNEANIKLCKIEDPACTSCE